MSKITREQLQKINNSCQNGWRLDVQYFLFHNEKRLYKHIELDNENYLEFALLYNYKNQIKLSINKFHHKQNDTFAVSQGLGKSKILDDTVATRKNTNNLIEFTKKLDDEQLMEINSTTEVEQSIMFVPTPAF